MLRPIIVLIVFSAGLSFTSPDTRAADENMNSSVYLAFDPATGQFVSKTKTPEEINEATSADIVQGHATPATIPQPETPAQSVASTQQQPMANAPVSVDSSSSLWVIAAIALTLAAIGGFLLKRKRG